MNRYLKLVNFELNRFMKIYLVLIGVTIVSQIIGVIVRANQYLSRANELIYEELMPKEAFLEQYGRMSFELVVQTLWFSGPIALCIATLTIYVLFIWYRDWLGKNTFIYRLLMLPTARINVYLAKATTILLFVLGLVSVQLILFPIESRILQLIVPIDFRLDLSIHEIISTFYHLNILFPNTFIEFLIYYGTGFAAVLVLFTAILFERSFRWKGIFFGLLYGGVSVLVFLSPILIESFILQEFFYPIELFVLEMITGLIVIAGSIWVSAYLLKKRIRV
ncbi:hypothetical protein ACFSTA_10210 [Ornithinibacillus salinisoli]|uniref:ABC transporter permease n=1 Tax=Ornithinibacillus salinisoli TaxID=1848459 RepID=A0ABW4W082_9BACI